MVDKANAILLDFIYERPFNTDYHAKTTSKILLLCDVTNGRTTSADHLVSSFMDDPKIFPIKNTSKY